MLEFELRLISFLHAAVFKRQGLLSFFGGVTLKLAIMAVLVTSWAEQGSKS